MRGDASACMSPLHRQRTRVRRAVAGPRTAAVAIALLVVGTSTRVHASPMALPRRTISPEGGVVTESSQVLPKWTPAVAVSLSHESDLVRADAATTGAAAAAELRSRTRADLGVAVGLFDWIELGVALPVVLRQRWVDNTAGGPRTGIGDARAGLKGTILRLPRRGLGLGVSFDVTAPTGAIGSHLGLGKPSYAPQLALEFRAARAIRAAFNLGYLARPDTRALGYVAGDELTLRSALRVPLSSRHAVAFVAEIDGRVALVRGARSDVQGFLGLRGATRSGVVIAGYVSGGPGLALGSSEVGGVLSFAWAPPSRTGGAHPFDGSPRPRATALALRHDALAAREPQAPPPVDPRDPDGDRVVASNDRCPSAAEDTDGFEDGDGCPELDDDHDGIADAFDLCPRAPEIVNGAQDADGCPDRRGTDGSVASFASLDGLVLAPVLEFENGTDELTAAGRAALDAWLELAHLNPWIERLELAIYVHATEDPATDRARALARAAALVGYCRAAGLEPWRVQIKELGAIPATHAERVRAAIVRADGGTRGLAPEPAALTRWLEQTRRDADDTPAQASDDARFSAQGPPPVP